MSDTTTTTEPFSEAELAVLTTARAIVEKVNLMSQQRAWGARNEPMLGKPTPYVWGRVGAAASQAGDAIFQLLNETNAGDIQMIPDKTMHPDLRKIQQERIQILEEDL